MEYSYSYVDGSNWTDSGHIESNTHRTTDGLDIGYKRKKNQELQNLWGFPVCLFGQLGR